MTPRVFVIFLLASACLGPLAHAQPTPKFEVATIKPADPSANGQFIRLPSPGRIAITNMTLLQIIRFAYAEGLGTNLEITGGPNWLDKDRFDVEAKAEGPATPPELRQMMRTLLAERFALKSHPDTKEVNVYALVLARSDGKLGPKIQPWDGKCNGREPPPAPADNPKALRCGAFFRPPGMVFEGAPMAVLAELLSTPPPNLGRPVVDRTGLSGEFTMTLEFQFRPPGPAGQAAPDDPLAPSLFTALQEQFGLKLQSARGNIDVLVVDQAEKPTAN
jgi:uncharacterized protein (TIGR03435 family)